MGRIRLVTGQKKPFKYLRRQAEDIITVLWYSLKSLSISTGQYWHSKIIPTVYEG